VPGGIASCRLYAWPARSFLSCPTPPLLPFGPPGRPTERFEATPYIPCIVRLCIAMTTISEATESRRLMQWLFFCGEQITIDYTTDGSGIRGPGKSKSFSIDLSYSCRKYKNLHASHTYESSSVSESITPHPLPPSLQ
jgi:hypothetical protein